MCMSADEGAHGTFTALHRSCLAEAWESIGMRGEDGGIRKGPRLLGVLTFSETDWKLWKGFQQGIDIITLAAAATLTARRPRDGHDSGTCDGRGCGNGRRVSFERQDLVTSGCGNNEGRFPGQFLNFCLGQLDPLIQGKCLFLDNSGRNI